MQPATSILLIRHAAAEHNGRAALCGGSCDPPLTGHGKLQVELLKSRLVRETAFSACYTSPLARALQTASAAPPPLAPVALDCLREIRVGPLEGALIERVQELFPEQWRRHLARSDDDFAWPGGETYRAFRERALAVMTELSARHPGERVLVFTHAGVISQIVGVLMGTPAGRWDLHRPANASITEVNWGGSARALVTFDDHRHVLTSHSVSS